MNTKRQTSYKLIEKLAAKKVKLNVTALMTLTQVRDVVSALDPNVPSYVSVFVGRVANTGLDPLPTMAAAVELLKVAPASELVWASPRELLNISHADSIGCQILR
jgi:transaldolase